MSNPPKEVAFWSTLLRNSSLRAAYAGATRRVNIVPESMMVPPPVAALKARAVAGMGSKWRPTEIPVNST